MKLIIVIVSCLLFIAEILHGETNKIDSLLNNKGEVELVFIKPTNINLYELSRKMSIVHRKGDSIWAYFNRKQY